MRTINSKLTILHISESAKSIDSIFERYSSPKLPSLAYQKLDPATHGSVINFPLSDEEIALANDPDVKPFAYVSDSAGYVRKIRKTTKL